MIIFCHPQHLQSQLDVKRPLVEQCLEAGRFYLREEGHYRLSADSGDSVTGRCVCWCGSRSVRGELLVMACR